MTLASIPAAIRNLRQANANLHQAARLLTDAGYSDHADTVAKWGADITKLADAGIVTLKIAQAPRPTGGKKPAAAQPAEPSTPSGAL